MKIDQIVLKSEEKTIIVVTRSLLDVPGNFTISLDELAPEVRAAVDTILAAVSRRLPQDISPEVLAEIRQLQGRLGQLLPSLA